MAIYLFIGLVLVAYSLVYDRLNERSTYWTYFFLMLFLFLFAGLRGLDVDRDYVMTYVDTAEHVPPFGSLFSSPIEFYKKLPHTEFSYCVLVSFLNLFCKNSAVIAALIYAAIAVPVKMRAMNRISADGTFGYVLLLYFANLYLLQEMTQIRAGVGTAFFLLALPEIYNRNFKRFLALIIIAGIFHKSMLIALPLYFLKSDTINFKYWFGCVLFFLFLSVVHYDLVSIVTKVDLPVFSDRLREYIQLQKWHQIKMNPFNTFLMLQLVVSVLVYVYRDKIYPHFKYLYLFIKINLISILFFYVFIGVPGFAFRISDFMGIAQLFLVSMLIYVFKPKYMAQFLIVGIAFCMLLFNLFHNHLLNPYATIFSDLL